MTWRKSSYSNVNGGECIEVGVWRKSSHSTTNGGSCVEVGTAAVATLPGTSTVGGDNSVAAGAAPWRKSSHSSVNGGDCLATATVGAAVAVRDTKDDGQGSVLRFPPRVWHAFTTTLK